jgi:methylmalonyl-CoA/ethylmalonyl-CoA epimerase
VQYFRVGPGARYHRVRGLTNGLQEGVSLLGIKRVDHVSMAVWDVEKQLPLFTDLFGMEVAGRFENPSEGFKGVVLNFPGKQLQLEILEPLGEDSFLIKFLEERGPGFHHITCEVEDVHRAADALREHGIEPFRGVYSDGEWRATFIHPRDSGGLLWQLFTDLPPEERAGASK